MAITLQVDLTELLYQQQLEVIDLELPRIAIAQINRLFKREKAHGNGPRYS